MSALEFHPVSFGSTTVHVDLGLTERVPEAEWVRAELLSNPRYFHPLQMFLGRMDRVRAQGQDALGQKWFRSFAIGESDGTLTLEPMWE